MEVTYKVKKSVDLIFDYLTDMQKFVFVHPVITKINKTGDNSYLVYETLKFGFIPFSFTYPVTIESNFNDKTIFMHATVMKITHIRMTYVLKAEKDFTIIEEKIQFNSPLPIKSIMQSIFKKQHEQLFKNIEQIKR